MNGEKRRNQRIRFNAPMGVRLGYDKSSYDGRLTNLSRQGLMVDTELSVPIGTRLGCEFSLEYGCVIDLSVIVVSHLGCMFGARFQLGPVSRMLIDSGIEASLTSGTASTLSFHEQGGKHLIRVTGGLSGILRSDFMHTLTRGNIDELDLAGVTSVEASGLALCLLAKEKYQVNIGACSPCFTAAWQQYAPQAQLNGD